MTNFPILDLVLGMFFIYFLLSVISNSFIEIIMRLSRARAKVLGRWLEKALDTTLANKLKDHIAVAALSKPGETPSYIDAKNFVTALLDLINNGRDGSTLQAIRTNVTENTGLPKGLKSMLLQKIDEAISTFNAPMEKTAGEIDTLRDKLERWYDTSQERLSGTIKKGIAMYATIAVSAVIAFAGNIDSIKIARYLYNNPEARAQLADKAIEASKDPKYIKQVEEFKANTILLDSNDTSDLDALIKQIDDKRKDIETAKAELENQIPMGWTKAELKEFYSCGSASLTKFFGLMATMLAIMLGAPFWFDILNKIANLRSTGPKPKKVSTKEES